MELPLFSGIVELVPIELLDTYAIGHSTPEDLGSYGELFRDSGVLRA